MKLTGMEIIIMYKIFIKESFRIIFMILLSYTRKAYSYDLLSFDLN